MRRGVYGSERFVITRHRFAGPPVEARAGDVAFVLATPTDLARLGVFDRDERRGEKYREAVSRHGDWLFVARQEPSLVAARLVSRRAPAHGLLAHVVALRPDQLWDTEVYCLPEHRGRGVARALSLFSDRYLAAEGYTEALGVIAATNIPSLRMHLHKGVELVSYVTYRRILCWKRLTVSREIPDLPGTRQYLAARETSAPPTSGAA